MVTQKEIASAVEKLIQLVGKNIVLENKILEFSPTEFYAELYLNLAIDEDEVEDYLWSADDGDPEHFYLQKLDYMGTIEDIAQAIKGDEQAIAKVTQHQSTEYQRRDNKDMLDGYLKEALLIEEDNFAPGDAKEYIPTNIKVQSKFGVITLYFGSNFSIVLTKNDWDNILNNMKTIITTETGDSWVVHQVNTGELMWPADNKTKLALGNIVVRLSREQIFDIDEQMEGSIKNESYSLIEDNSMNMSDMDPVKDYANDEPDELKMLEVIEEEVNGMDIDTLLLFAEDLGLNPSLKIGKNVLKQQVIYALNNDQNISTQEVYENLGLDKHWDDDQPVEDYAEDIDEAFINEDATDEYIEGLDKMIAGLDEWIKTKFDPFYSDWIENEKTGELDWAEMAFSALQFIGEQADEENIDNVIQYLRSQIEPKRKATEDMLREKGLLDESKISDTAFEQGFNAFFAGKSRNRNPYGDTAKGDEWISGWEEANSGKYDANGNEIGEDDDDDEDYTIPDYSYLKNEVNVMGLSSCTSDKKGIRCKDVSPEEEMKHQPRALKESIYFEMTGSPKYEGFKTKQEFLNKLSSGARHTDIKHAEVLVVGKWSPNNIKQHRAEGGRFGEKVSNKFDYAKKHGLKIMSYREFLKKYGNLQEGFITEGAGSTSRYLNFFLKNSQDFEKAKKIINSFCKKNNLECKIVLFGKGGLECEIYGYKNKIYKTLSQKQLTKIGQTIYPILKKNDISLKFMTGEESKYVDEGAPYEDNWDIPFTNESLKISLFKEGFGIVKSNKICEALNNTKGDALLEELWDMGLRENDIEKVLNLSEGIENISKLFNPSGRRYHKEMKRISSLFETLQHINHFVEHSDGTTGFTFVYKNQEYEGQIIVQDYIVEIFGESEVKDLIYNDDKLYDAIIASYENWKLNNPPQELNENYPVDLNRTDDDDESEAKDDSYYKGWEAANEGESAESNPYKKGTKEHMDWINGWNECNDDNYNALREQQLQEYSAPYTNDLDYDDEDPEISEEEAAYIKGYNAYPKKNISNNPYYGLNEKLAKAWHDGYTDKKDEATDSEFLDEAFVFEMNEKQMDIAYEKYYDSCKKKGQKPMPFNKWKKEHIHEAFINESEGDRAFDEGYNRFNSGKNRNNVYEPGSPEFDAYNSGWDAAYENQEEPAKRNRFGQLLKPEFYGDHFEDPEEMLDEDENCDYMTEGLEQTSSTDSMEQAILDLVRKADYSGLVQLYKLCIGGKVPSLGDEMLANKIIEALSTYSPGDIQSLYTMLEEEGLIGDISNFNDNI